MKVHGGKDANVHQKDASVPGLQTSTGQGAQTSRPPQSS